MKKIDVRQENINDWVLLIVEAIQEKVPEITDDDIDPIWDELELVLDKFFGYPEYRNYN